MTQSLAANYPIYNTNDTKSRHGKKVVGELDLLLNLLSYGGTKNVLFRSYRATVLSDLQSGVYIHALF